MLKEGTKAPDFSLLDQNGETINLKDFKVKKYCYGFIQKQVHRVERLKVKSSVMSLIISKKKIL